MPVTHGHTVNGKRSLTHNSWHALRERTLNPNCIYYPRYGGKGITCCERWNKFKNFLEDMGERPGKEYTIDRIDNTLGYTPENCRWATRTEQNRNRSCCIYIEIEGKKQTVKEWSIEIGINRQTIERRLKLGWSDYDAVMQPVVRGQKFKKSRTS